MIDLNDRRPFPGYVCLIHQDTLPDIDLSSLALGDHIANVGSICDYSVLGFLHTLGHLGFHLSKSDEKPPQPQPPTTPPIK